MIIYYLESEGLTTACQCMAIFILPCSTWARILPHPVHMTHGPGGCLGPTSQWRLPAGRFGGVDWGVWGLRVRVNRRARSAPLSLSGRAHITAVIMWSCLPHHTPTAFISPSILFSFYSN